MYCRAIELSASRWVIETLSCCWKALDIKVLSFAHHELSSSAWTAIVVKLLFKCQCQTLSHWSTLLITDVCIRHWINFFYRQGNHLSEYQKEALLIVLSRKCFNQTFVSASGFLVKRSWLIRTANRAHLLLPHHIVANNFEAEVSPIESWSYCVQWVVHLVFMSFE